MPRRGGNRPLSNKERQQRWRDRQKQTAEAHAQYLAAERERYATRIATGKLKLVGDMSAREKRMQRKNWRLRQQRRRDKVNEEKDRERELLTPPTSPADAPNPNRRRRGRRNVRKDRAAAYRQVKRLTVKLQVAKKQNKRIQKRLERVRQADPNSKDMTASPRRKSKILLNSGNARAIRKELTYSFSVADALKSRYHSLETQREKKAIRQIFDSQYLRKYRLLRHVEAKTGIHKRLLRSTALERKRRRDAHSDRTIKAIQDFLTRDDNSTMRPGKKDAISRHGDKHQVRVLNDSLTNLHLKFLCEHRDMKTGYIFFTNHKPFWVRAPKLADRDTCKCHTHENVQLMADALFNYGVIKQRDPEKLLESICCSISNSACMYRECSECADRRLPFETYEQTSPAVWEEWRIVDHEYFNKATGKIETTRKTAKVKCEGTMDRLADTFEERLGRKLARHVYNVRHQYRELRELKLSLAPNEALYHIDFSENYALKYHEQIQSAHFGASNQQATLHTGMVYLQNEEFGFATVSGCRRHDAAAIWAHLKPILEKVSGDHPDIDTVYFVSDGPTTQYRCKANFFLMSFLPYEWGMTSVNWSFLEAGHGKGAADGIGGVLKRTADRVVAEGKDIPEASALFDVLSENTKQVWLGFVSEDDVNKIDDVLNTAGPLRALPGTMSFHQLTSTAKGEIFSRRLSCFCQHGKGQKSKCNCFKPVRHVFPSVYSGDKGEKESKDDTVTIATGDIPTPSPVDMVTGFRGNNDEAPPKLVERPVKVGNVSRRQGRQDPTLSLLVPVPVYDESLVGKFCVVQYDRKAFPAIIEDANEESVRVDCMCRVPRKTNEFFWPDMKDNEVWYEYDDIITLIPQPNMLDHETTHYKVQQEIWDAVLKKLDQWVR